MDGSRKDSVVRTSGWKLSEVESLSLEGEGITSLGKDSFSGVGKLVYLSLARNNISSLLGIEHLSSLVTAIFLANRISIVEEIRRLAPLSNLRNVDLRLNPIMSMDSAGDGLSGEASVLSRSFGCQQSRGNPRTLVLAVLTRVTNLNGQKVTWRERQSLLAAETGQNDRPPKESKEIHRRPPAPAAPWREAREVFHIAGSARSLPTTLAEHCSVVSRAEEKGCGDTGIDLRNSQTMLIPVEDDIRLLENGVAIVKTQKKRDRTGEGVGVNANVEGREGYGGRSDDVDDRGGIWIEPVGRRGGARSVANSCGGRRRRGAPAVGLAEACPDPKGDGCNDEDDEDLAALWRELDAGSLALRRAPPAVSQCHTPRDLQSRGTGRRVSRSPARDRSFSGPASSPPPPSSPFARKDTRLLMAELDGSRGGAGLKDAVKPGVRDEHRLDAEGLLVDRRPETAGMAASGGDGGCVTGDTGAMNDFKGVFVVGKGEGGCRANPPSECGKSPHGRDCGEPGSPPANCCPPPDDPVGLEVTAVTRDKLPSAETLSIRGRLAPTLLSSEPSTAVAAARALEAFRQSSQRLGLRGATTSSGPAVAARGHVPGDTLTVARCGRVGGNDDAVRAGGDQLDPGLPSEGVLVSKWEGKDIAQSVRGTVTGDGHDLDLSDVRARGAPFTSRTGAARDSCVPSMTAPMTSHCGATLAATAAGGARCKECGAAVEGRVRIEPGDGTFVASANKGGEADKFWRQREMEFAERWKARERDFEERWAAREREIDERRREESKVMQLRTDDVYHRESAGPEPIVLKEFTWSMRGMLFEAHEALISSNAWLVERLKAVEASRPSISTLSPAGHGAPRVWGGTSGSRNRSGNGAPTQTRATSPWPGSKSEKQQEHQAVVAAAASAAKAAGSEAFGMEKNVSCGITTDSGVGAAVQYAEKGRQGTGVWTEEEEAKKGSAPSRAVSAPAVETQGERGDWDWDGKWHGHGQARIYDREAVRLCEADAAAAAPRQAPPVSASLGCSGGLVMAPAGPRSAMANVPTEPREPPPSLKRGVFCDREAAAAVSEPRDLDRAGAVGALKNSANVVILGAASGAQCTVREGSAKASGSSGSSNSNQSIGGSGGTHESKDGVVVAIAAENLARLSHGSAREDGGMRWSGPRPAPDAAPLRATRPTATLASASSAGENRVEGAATRVGVLTTHTTEHHHHH